MHALAAASQSTDPWTLIVPAAAVLIVGLLGFWNARWAADKAGLSVQSTIEADRRARILERQLTLYGELLTFVAQRRQNREKVLSRVTISGVEVLDQYDPLDVFALEGRARAIADAAVLTAFTDSNDAAQAVMHKHMAGLIVPTPGNALSDHQEIERLRVIANDCDDALKEVIRTSLHH